MILSLKFQGTVATTAAVVWARRCDLNHPEVPRHEPLLCKCSSGTLCVDACLATFDGVVLDTVLLPLPHVCAHACAHACMRSVVWCGMACAHVHGIHACVCMCGRMCMCACRCVNLRQVVSRSGAAAMLDY